MADPMSVKTDFEAAKLFRQQRENINAKQGQVTKGVLFHQDNTSVRGSVVGI